MRQALLTAATAVIAAIAGGAIAQSNTPRSVTPPSQTTPQAGTPQATTPLSPAARRATILQACQADMQSLCAGMTPGDGKLGPCLRANRAAISQACKTAIRDTRVAARADRWRATTDGQSAANR